MATMNPYDPSADPYDPTAAIRARVRSTLQSTADPTQPVGATSDATPSTPSPSFYSGTTTTDTQSPADAPPSTSQPAALTTPAPNPYDPNNPANQGTGGTFNQPAPGNDANQIQGWFGAYLNRPASNDDLTYWLNQAQTNPGGLSYVQNQIANSPEAMAYAKSKGFGQPNPPSTPAAPAAPATPGTASVTAPPTSGFTDALRAILMQRLQSASAPVDENSPQIASAISAARDEGTRASEQERTALAENLYAHGGLNTAAIPQQIQQSAEKQALGIGSLRATLIAQAYTQKQAELENDLQLAFASGDAESARQIQIQIANLQATVQREGIGANLAINSANQNTTTVAAGA